MAAATKAGPVAYSRGTLGEVLYANAKAPALESDWVLLVESIAGGDQPALHALYLRAHRLVYTLMMRMTGNRETAEELTLDVFHDVWRKAPHYDPAAGTVLGWIMNQARSRAIDRLRFEQRKKRVQPEHDFAEPGEANDSAELLECKQRSGRLKSALTVLTEQERQAIEAAYFQGLTYQETADKLAQPLGTIKTRIRSGLLKLREALAPERSVL
jgi:RNA polymerase sigma-70 factor (ECF subfamily)